MRRAWCFIDGGGSRDPGSHHPASLFKGVTATHQPPNYTTFITPHVTCVSVSFLTHWTSLTRVKFIICDERRLFVCLEFWFDFVCILFCSELGWLMMDLATLRVPLIQVLSGDTSLPVVMLDDDNKPVMKVTACALMFEIGVLTSPLHSH